MGEERRTYEPNPAFEARLESQVVAEVRRRNREAPAPRWMSWTPAQVAVAVAVIVLVSAGLGGAVVATAYEVQQNQIRDQIAVNVEQRVSLAQQRLDLVTADQQAEQRKFDVGLSDTSAVLQKGVAVAQARAELQRLKLDLEEVRASGREPRTEMSAPRVAGRDFVGERLEAERTVPDLIVDVEQRLLQQVTARIEIGTLPPEEAGLARSRVVDAESLRQYVARRIEIRRLFLAGRIDATETELRALEAEAEHKVRSLEPKVTLARADVVRFNERAAVGVARLVDVAEAKLRQADLEAALSKAELDLAVVRQRLKEHRR